MGGRGGLRVRFALTLVRSGAQQQRFQTMSDGIIGKIDDMGSRIDELEKSIGDIMQQAGIEDEGDEEGGGEGEGEGGEGAK